VDDPKEADTGWFVVISYADVGHVNDEDKDTLNSDHFDDMLATISQATNDANAERSRRGWTALNVDGWEEPPFYDEDTHHLTWAIRASSADGHVVNYNSRILGRAGMLNANMVVDPQTLADAVPAYRTLTKAIIFNSGQRYEEFRQGDRVARYGLIALITGGAAVVAVKSWGLILKIGAFILVALSAIGAKIRSLFRRKSPQPAVISAAPAKHPTSQTSATDGDFAVVHCSVCGASNRVRRSRLAEAPRCGRCKAVLNIA
jgi:uncharacterized membrane-anchored protein